MPSTELTDVKDVAFGSASPKSDSDLRYFVSIPC